MAFVTLPGEPAQRAEALRRFLTDNEIFAIVCGDFSGTEAEIAAVLRDTGTPSLAALAAFPQTGFPLNPYVFYLDGGIKEEAAALIKPAAGKNVQPRMDAPPAET